MLFSRGTIRILTLFLILVATIMSGIGGLSDMLGTPLYVSKEHAWRDASFVLLLAILINIMV